MRRRRGAIHSNDEEEFIQLSILSEKNLGIFYNDQPEVKKQEGIFKESNWSQFDFNYDQKMQNEQIEQQEKQSGKRMTTNVILAFQKTKIILKVLQSTLMSVLDIPNPQCRSNQTLELIIKEFETKNRIIKFWLTSIDYSSMLESYYRMSDVFILIPSSQSLQKSDKQVQIISSIKMQKAYQTIIIPFEFDSQQVKLKLQQILNKIIS